MLIWLVRNWRLIVILSAAVALFGAGLHVRGLIADKRLESQKNSLIKECNQSKHTLMEANDALQSKVSIVSKRLADSKRLPAVCVRVNSGMANNSADRGEHAGQNGLSTGWLREYAAECETYRIELIELDNFGRKHCNMK
jgi:hypothetical protein